MFPPRARSCLRQLAHLLLLLRDGVIAVPAGVRVGVRTRAAEGSGEAGSRPAACAMERPADGQPPRQARQTTISAARAHGLRTASTSACPFSTLSSSGLPGEAGARGNTTPPSRSIRGGWVAPPEAHAHAPFNEHVHRLLVLGAERLAIMPRTAVLDRALATDHDLAARLPLHALLRVAARPDDGAEEVVARVLFDGHDELAPTPLRHLGGEGGGGGQGEGGVERPQAPGHVRECRVPSAAQPWASATRPARPARAPASAA